jgi:putative membrane protein
MGGMMGGGFGAYGTVGLILNLVITIGVIIGIAVLIVWAVRRLSPDSAGLYARRQTEGALSNPKEIAQRRYARGDITRDQYQELMTDLT